MDKKFSVNKSNWKGRKNKTYQDRLPKDMRERVQNWERVISFSQNHKPATTSDWVKLRQK
jgi:hypothetical protein